MKYARTGDIIRLQPGCYVELDPIVLAHDGVKIVAAAVDGARARSSMWQRVLVVSHAQGQGQDCLVSQSFGCEIQGIEFVHSSLVPASASASEEHAAATAPQDSCGCVRVESGDVQISHCSFTSWSGYGIKVVAVSPCLA